MTMDQYKEQYKKETEQIHAPAELIAKTKAAMREEEVRLRREAAEPRIGSERKGAPTGLGPMTTPADGGKYGRRFAFRRWAYPLTAAAALLILVSVSLTMRGLKSEDMASGSGAYEEMAMESSEMPDGADADGGMAAAGAIPDAEGATEAVVEAAMDSGDVAETAEEASADEMLSADADKVAAAPMEDLSETVEENAALDEAASSEAAGDISAEKAESEGDGQQRKRSDAEQSLAEEETASEEKKAQSGGALAAAEKITIEKVAKRPAFYGRSGTEAHIFEGETFYVAKEENDWAAYVESEDGNKYVIRGEAEDLETFLEMGYEKMVEMKEK